VPRHSVLSANKYKRLVKPARLTLNDIKALPE